MIATPKGWRLPSKEECELLINYFGDSEIAYNNLLFNGNSGFHCLLGGTLGGSGNYFDFEYKTGFWTSTKSNNHNECHWVLYFSQKRENVYMLETGPDRGAYYIRCIKDN